MKNLKIQSRKIIYFVEDNIKNGYVIYGEAGVVKILGLSRKEAIKAYMKYAKTAAGRAAAGYPS